MVVSTMGLRLAYKFERCDYPEEMGGDAVMKWRYAAPPITLGIMKSECRVVDGILLHGAGSHFEF